MAREMARPNFLKDIEAGNRVLKSPAPLKPLPVVQADPIRDRFAKFRAVVEHEPDEPFDPDFGNGRRRVSRKLKRR